SGLKDMATPGCQLTVSLEVNREQSFIQVEARFERDDNDPVAFSKFQTMRYRFHVFAIKGPQQLVFTTLKKLPRSLEKNEQAKRLFARGELHELHIEFDSKHLVAEGIKDKYNFRTSKLVKHAKQFANIQEKGHFKIIVQLEGQGFQKRLEVLKKKMQLEWRTPPFSEYIAKGSGRYT
ncbi:MAG: hypothetical protein Q9180_009669, partial [Flavoplaca navasiana]